jgi:hypothetical protein
MYIPEYTSNRDWRDYLKHIDTLLHLEIKLITFLRV